jgi:hypothetical protein
MFTVERGIRFVSYVLAGVGGYLLIRSAGTMAAVGVVLLIWSNNCYEASR